MQKVKDKKQRRISDKQWWFVWKTIGELQAYLNNQIEAGAIGSDKHSDNGTRAKQIIEQHRRWLRSQSSNK